MRSFNHISFYLFILHVLIFLNNISCNVIINDNKSNSNVSNIDNLKTEYDDDALNVNKWENEKHVSGNSEDEKDENKYYPSDVCEKVGIFSQCPKKSFNSMNDWTYRNKKNSSEVNTGLYVPPRRNKLCLLDLGKRKNGIKDMNKFKEELLKVASGESYSLMEYFKNEPSNAIAALDYSFADLGDIVKGTDLMDNKYTRNINTSLYNIFSKQNGDNDIIKKRLEWWNNNKNDIWEAMVCGYSGNKKVENFPEHNNIDEVPQRFRWFREWGKDVCYEYEYNLYVVIKLCKIKRDKNNDELYIEEMQKNDECTKGLDYYLGWINKRKTQWDYQSQMFNNYKGTYDNAKELTPQSYLHDKCIECNCKNKDLENTFKEKKNKDEILKVLIERSKDIKDEIMRALESSTQIISNDFTNEDEDEQINNSIEETSEDIKNVFTIRKSENNTSYDNISEYITNDGDENLEDVEEEEIYEDSENIYGPMKEEPRNLPSKRSVKKRKGTLRGGESNNRADKWKLSWSWSPWTIAGVGIRKLFSRVTDPMTYAEVASSIPHVAENLVRTSAGIETSTSSEGRNSGSLEEEEEDDDDDDDDDSSSHGSKGSQETSSTQENKETTDMESPYDRILGWEFGPVAVPGKIPNLFSEEKNLLELVNLTSWDKDDIVKDSEDVKHEIEEQRESQEHEEEEIEENVDEIEVEEEVEVDEEEEIEEEEDVEEEQQEQSDTKATEKNVQEKDQTTKDKEKENEETADLTRDNNAHQSLKERYNDNEQLKKVAESIVKDLFSLFKEKNTFESLLKDLTGDITRLFQNK
ncbi:duffy binding-like merozoite surface protein, putative [Plasmodium sp. gorilla clade G2]|uniref:duffy binding-like merozoite surface protein, putative n=1 Tax=Plasmodium sp. gorilla clade G2 TaxID=880535 RepID=UPI000D2107B7|nr:duffy binding-like merozoite surface protein, putative [Plasmodium sp. gorilla clade G2]SOV15233.1 duffy binding-like merozoite surface protein, putative [Plasmodium sp. gorilla clade G2]